MTKKEIQEIKDRWAQHKEWAYGTDVGGTGDDDSGFFVVMTDDTIIARTYEDEPENAYVIASAPADIAALLAEIDRLNRMTEKVYAEMIRKI